jgi:hypothetical protein
MRKASRSRLEPAASVSRQPRTGIDACAIAAKLVRAPPAAAAMYGGGPAKNPGDASQPRIPKKRKLKTLAIRRNAMREPLVSLTVFAPRKINTLVGSISRHLDPVVIWLGTHSVVAFENCTSEGCCPRRPAGGLSTTCQMEAGFTAPARRAKVVG